MPKKKTARPEMCWLESRKQWRKRISIDGKQHNIFGKTQDEVREKVRELERQHEAGMILGDETTLAQFCKEWFPVKTAGLSVASGVMYANAINVHILPFFKNMKLSDIRPLHVQKLLANRPELSKSMQSKVLLTLSQIVKAAIENGLISKNPCQGIKAGGREAQAKKPLTKPEQDILVSAVEGKRCALFVLLCLYAGLRREEALGLLWSNVHTDKGAPYIDVRHTVTFAGGRPVHSESLKSRAARRSIPIPPVLSDALKAARKAAKSVFVVPSVNEGGAMSETAFRRMWEMVTGYWLTQKERDKDGKWVVKKDEDNRPIKRFVPGAVDFHVEPHMLRHTYLTELCASGLDIKKIQYLAGHEDVTMTLRVYAHVTENTPQELSGSIVKIFSGTTPGTNGEKSKIEQKVKTL